MNGLLAVVLVLIVAGVVVFAIVSRRAARLVQVGAGRNPSVRPIVYDDPPSGTTGDVEILGPKPSGAVDPPPATVIATAVPLPPVFDVDLEPSPPIPAEQQIRWAKQFDPRSTELDDQARLRLIGDLGVIAKEWCVPLLVQAYAEEPRTANRQAALTALAACRSRSAIATYRSALDSIEPAERAIAADALADLDPPAPTKTRPVVERR